MADAGFEELVERIARARDEGRSTQQILRMTAAFLEEQPGGAADPRRAQLQAQLTTLLRQARLVQALADAKGEERAMAPLMSLFDALRGAAPQEEREARVAETLARLEQRRDALSVQAEAGRTADDGWLWGVPNEDPGTLEFGPALDDAEIARWEERHGVALPAVLREAYRQQNGGLIRSQRIFLYRLEEVEPVGPDYFADLGEEPPAPYDPALTFDFGYDDAWGTTAFLAYRSAEDREPVFYGYYSDGGSVAWTTAPAEIMREAARG